MLLNQNDCSHTDIEHYKNSFGLQMQMIFILYNTHIVIVMYLAAAISDNGHTEQKKTPKKSFYTAVASGQHITIISIKMNQHTRGVRGKKDEKTRIRTFTIQMALV